MISMGKFCYAAIRAWRRTVVISAHQHPCEPRSPDNSHRSASRWTPNRPSRPTPRPLDERVHDELIDAVDEELELEIDDSRLAGLLEHTGYQPAPETLDRHIYFKELLRLQKELVKLQDWVVHQKLKLMVLFEGRDAAGKGGVIKRITQRLNPRICKVVALSAPTERERTQWYFQRYVSHLSAGGEIVLFDRCWYNRAGVERVMGFCAERIARASFDVPEFERMLARMESSSSSTGSRSPTKSKSRASRRSTTIRSSSGSSARWIWKAAPAGKRTPMSKRRLLERTTYSRRPLVGGGGRRQEARATELHRSSAAANPLRRGAAQSRS